MERARMFAFGRLAVEGTLAPLMVKATFMHGECLSRNNGLGLSVLIVFRANLLRLRRVSQYQLPLILRQSYGYGLIIPNKSYLQRT